MTQLKSSRLFDLLIEDSRVPEILLQISVGMMLLTRQEVLKHDSAYKLCTGVSKFIIADLWQLAG